MGRESSRDRELRDAARELALHLKYVEEDPDGQLLDLGVVSVEDEDDEDDEGMETAREQVQDLMDQGSELVEDFEEDLDLAVEYIGKILEDAQAD